MKRVIILTVLFGLCLVPMAAGQEPGDTLWTRTYGGSDSDRGRSIQKTSDGGYIIAGGSTSFGPGGADVYLLKTDSSGDTLWTRTYGGTLGDAGYSVQQTSDGGYIIAGDTYSFGAGDCDVYLVKTDPSGDTLWTRTYGGSHSDEGRSLQQTSDGGYIIAGRTSSFGAGSYDIYLLKVAPSGDTLWTRTYGGRDSDLGYCVEQTDEGAYIIAGATRSLGAGDYDVYLIKVVGDVVAVDGLEFGSSLATSPSLSQNYPNPFNAKTEITYTLAGAGHVNLGVYNLGGQLTEILVDSYQGAGEYQVVWDASELASGIYFYRLTAGDFTETRRAALLK